MISLTLWGRLLIFIIALETVSRLVSAQSPILNQTQIPTSQVESLTDRITKIDSLDDAGRQALLSDVNDNRHKLSVALTKELHSKDNDVRCCAAYLAGQYHLEDLTFILASMITLKDTRQYQWNRESRMGPPYLYGDRYPAEYALMVMGESAVPPVFQNLKNSDDPVARRLSLNVIESVLEYPNHYGPNAEVVQKFLKAAILDEKDGMSKHKLQVALSQMSKETYLGRDSL